MYIYIYSSSENTELDSPSRLAQKAPRSKTELHPRNRPSEIIMDVQWPFPTDVPLSAVLPKGVSLVQWICTGVVQWIFSDIFQRISCL